MPPRYLLDTDICIYIRRRQPKVIGRLERLTPGEVAISVITQGELSYGVLTSAMPEGAREGFRRLMELLPVLPLPAEAGEIYGALRGSLQRKGNIIGPNDLWIAAHAIAQDLVLVTNNDREFGRVTDLVIENWAK